MPSSPQRGEDRHGAESPRTDGLVTSSPSRHDLAPFEDETDIILGNDMQEVVEEEDGEELFGDAMERYMCWRKLILCVCFPAILIRGQMKIILEAGAHENCSFVPFYWDNSLVYETTIV